MNVPYIYIPRSYYPHFFAQMMGNNYWRYEGKYRSDCNGQQQPIAFLIGDTWLPILAENYL
jgi:hypothetical protein